MEPSLRHRRTRRRGLHVPPLTVDLEKYRQLFIHRSDVFAVQQPTGAYFPERRPLEDDDVLEHLAGFSSIGTYVIRPEDQTVKYVVFDLDTYDEEETSWLCKCVEEFVLSAAAGGDASALRALQLESSGGKGHHIWLHLSEPVPAARVRAWLQASFWPLWERYEDMSAVRR